MGILSRSRPGGKGVGAALQGHSRRGKGGQGRDRGGRGRGGGGGGGGGGAGRARPPPPPGGGWAQRRVPSPAGRAHDVSSTGTACAPGRRWPTRCSRPTRPTGRRGVSTPVSPPRRGPTGS